MSSSSSSSSSKESESTPSRCQWSQLPSDLLEFICTKLTSPIADYIHFRGVCRSWRSAAKSAPFPPQIPLLIIPTDAITRFFLNPINGRVVPINLPQARGLAVCGSSNGWLVLIDDMLDVSLLNPMTVSTLPLPSSSATFLGALGGDGFENLNPMAGSTLPLPSSSATFLGALWGDCFENLNLMTGSTLPLPSSSATFLGALGGDGFENLNPMTGSTLPLPSSSATFLGALGGDGFENLAMDFSKIRHRFSCYAFMDSYPSDPTDCVIAFTAGFKWLVYCRLGDARWTGVIYSSSDSDGIASLAYHKGRFYSMDLSGSVSVYDVGGGVYGIRRIAASPSLKRPRCCYMMVWGDDLLIVIKRYGRGRITKRFEVFKLDSSDDLNLRWEKLGGIGELKLFLHLDSVCSIVGSDASGCRGNSVYSISRSETGNGVTERIHVYDIESGITQLLPYHHNLPSKSEKSIWFTPKF